MTNTDSILTFLGKGACGYVWTAAEEQNTRPTAPALKRYTNNPGRSLRNDADIHQDLLAKLAGHPPDLRTFLVPRFLSFDKSSRYQEDGFPDTELGKLVARLPPEHKEPRDSLLSERIPSVSKAAREAIIDKYCPPNLRDEIDSLKAHHGSQDCIIRPLVGRRRCLLCLFLRSKSIHVV